jgi:hypothetical protein
MAAATSKDEVQQALRSAAQLIINRIGDVTNALKDQRVNENQKIDWDVVRDMMQDAANLNGIELKRLQTACEASSGSEAAEIDSESDPETVTVTMFACKRCAPYKLFKREISYKKHRRLHKQKKRRLSH